MGDTSLLDLPDELLIRCLAGAGGMGIGAASAACTRLLVLGNRLRQLPVFSSALSTHASLQQAIKNAAQRALCGCYGVVDFALLFVANYGTARGKKYNDPTDLGHAVEMLKEVLGQDPVIVGCACAGLMGVGPDSQPIEVDPQANTPYGRQAASARKKRGLPQLPTKGVAVLLGKMPTGCVVRALAQETMKGPAEPHSPDMPPEQWLWPELDEALSLTSSQKAQLTQQLQAMTSATAAHEHHRNSAGSAADTVNFRSLSAGAAPAGPTAEELGASPSTAAAAEQLLSVVAAASVAEQQQASSAVVTGGDDVQLVPQLCLLLYDSSLHSFGYTESAEMDRAIRHMAAKGVIVIGGASSGAGDLFFSPGAEASRLSADPPASPQVVGLMLCTAKAPAPAPAGTAEAAAAPCTNSCAAGACASAGGAAPARVLPAAHAVTETGSSSHTNVSQRSGGAAAAAAVASTAPSAAPVQMMDSHAALQTAAFSAMGLGPSPSAPLFADIKGSLNPAHAYSTHPFMTLVLSVTKCRLVTPLTAEANTDRQEQSAATASAEGTCAVGGAPIGTAAAANSSGAAPGSSTDGHMRRSARLASQSAAAAEPAGAVLSPMHHLYAAIEAKVPVPLIADDEEDSGHYLAVWHCPAGSSPAPFTGDEEQAVVCELLSCDYDGDMEVIKPNLAVLTSSLFVLRQLLMEPLPGGTVCMQFVGTSAAACAATIKRSLTQLLPLLHHSPAATTTAGGSLVAATPTPAAVRATHEPGRAMQDCYAALARTAVATGARSGLQGLAVCSCTGRGQQLYAPDDEDTNSSQGTAGSGAICEAGLVDAASGSSVPFVGVYVSGELGPDVHNMCAGWCKPGQGSQTPAEMQGFTSMFAGWGCQPGNA